MDERRCPECGVTMASGDLVDGSFDEPVRFRTEEKGEGLLGRFGRKKLPVDGYACPECRLVRLYASAE